MSSTEVSENNENTTNNRAVKKGQRPRFFICSAIKQVKGEPQIIKSRVYFHPEGEEKVREKHPDITEGLWADPSVECSKEEAIKLFKKHKKLDPLDVEGPLFDVRSSSTQDKPRLTVLIKHKDIRYTQNRFAAKFQDWPVVAHGLLGCTSKSGESFKDDELVFLFFDEEARPTGENGKKLRKPTFGPNARPVIRFSDLQNPKPAE